MKHTSKSINANYKIKVYGQGLNTLVGVRGLRAIVEDILMDIMFTIPSDESVTRCIITKDVVAEGAAPVLEHGMGLQEGAREAGRRISGRDEIA